MIKNFFHKNSFKKSNILQNRNLKKKFTKIINDILIDIDTPKNSFHTLGKKFKFNFKIKDLKKFKKFKSVVIIGMGGSILGAEAINQFLRYKIKKNFFFFDNINKNYFYDFQKKNKTKNTLFLIISKSGNTIETVSNLLSLNILKRKAKNIIVISEKNNNFLFNLSQKLNLFYIEHKNYIGGRFSVLSEVGMLPAYLMGINIKKLRSNIRKYLKNKEKIFLKNSVTKLATALNQKNFKTLIFLNYVPELEKFLYWCQQLIAESLGKNSKGFLPVISNAPKDHHSLLQLYLDGPRDKIFYIFSSEEYTKSKINSKKYGNKLNYLNNKSLSEIKRSQMNALVEVLKKYKISFRKFRIRRFKEETLGELFSYFILETAIIGKLANINPFNQPAVEQVKKITKNNLVKRSKYYF